ncbi:MAG: hypothetical protein HND59_11310 [Pseudomonadota bacterium]|nr:MAG: hypothetical protein HND59_11310 [Pseudomonadota bacterium]
MIDRGFFRFMTGLVVATVFAWTLPAFSANYPLELVSPRAAGTAPAVGNASISQTHRVFKAYPGLEYNIRAVVVGGAYPYQFALTNAPSGMTIDENTGLIVWENPQQNASPTLIVTDSEGASASSTWTIDVTSSGFKFVDAIRGGSYPAGTGTIDNPWRNLSDLINASSATAGDIVYFRTGVYNAEGIPRGSVGSAWERIEFSTHRNKPVAWIAYPGEAPVIDFGFRSGIDPGVLIRFAGPNIYVDGFEARNTRVIGFQLSDGEGSNYAVFRQLKMHDLNMVRANLEGTNASLIMTTSAYSNSNTGGNASTWSQYPAIQDCEFYNAPVDLAIKTYSLWKSLIEDNVFHDLNYGIEIKADMPQFTYRGNTHYGSPGRAIGGNMHSFTTHGEILFNLVNEPSGQFALDVNQDSQAKRIDIYRNTFIGRVRVRSVDSSDGPFRLYNNVVVNNDSGTGSAPHIYLEEISDPSRIIVSNNITGYPGDNIVDSSGALTSAYSEYVTTHGSEMRTGGGLITAAPSHPGNVSVEPQ